MRHFVFAYLALALLLLQCRRQLRGVLVLERLVPLRIDAVEHEHGLLALLLQPLPPALRGRRNQGRGVS